MHSFVKKLAIYLLPLVVLTVPFFLLDPFKIIYKYENYYAEGTLYPVTTDYGAVQNFINRYDQEKYDAFIFGSSAAINYHTEDWVKHLDGPVRPYQFAVGGESVYGIERKLNFLKEKEIPVKKALISLEYYALKFHTNRLNLIKVKHPVISKQSRLSFYTLFLKGYFKEWFNFRYFHYKITGSHKLVYQNKVRAAARVDCIPKTNDIAYTWWEDQIKADSIGFFDRPIFHSMPDLDKEPHFEEILSDSGREILQKIASHLEELGTDYVVMIPPFFQERKLHPKDTELIYKIFGEEKVYNFESHPEFSQMKHGFYDLTHCRPLMGRLVMNELYESVPANSW